MTRKDTQGHARTRKDTQGRARPSKTAQGRATPRKATQGHARPRKAAQGHARTRKDTQGAGAAPRCSAVSYSWRPTHAINGRAVESRRELIASRAKYPRAGRISTLPIRQRPRALTSRRRPVTVNYGYPEAAQWEIIADAYILAGQHGVCHTSFPV